MFEELGISFGTALVVLIVKWAVKNGIKEAYRDLAEKRDFGMPLPSADKPSDS